MSNYANLKSAIQSVIKTNGNNEITGQLLQTELLAMINTLGYGYQFMGVASPNTVPGTPDAKVFYLAYEAGTYTNFGGIVVTGFCVLKYATDWSKDDIPISGGGGGTDFTLQADDLAFTGGSVPKLRFANRINGVNIESGLDYFILRDDISFQNQVTVGNTIYEIRYDFDLGGQSIQIPANCELRFNGGSLTNGSIVFQDTLLSGNPKITCSISGSLANDEINIEWFGGKLGDSSFDNSPIIERVCAAFNKVTLFGDIYCASPISITGIESFVNKGTLSYNGSGNEALLTFNDILGSKIELGNLTNYSGASDAVGVQFSSNTDHCDISFRSIDGFSINFLVNPATNKHFAYNTIRLGLIMSNGTAINICLDGTNSGTWINENLWLGGRITVKGSSDPTNNVTGIRYKVPDSNYSTNTTFNNNVWLKPSFEYVQLPLYFSHTRRNYFRFVRNENNSGSSHTNTFIKAEKDSFGNIIQFGYTDGYCKIDNVNNKYAIGVIGDELARLPYQDIIDFNNFQKRNADNWGFCKDVFSLATGHSAANVYSFGQTIRGTKSADGFSISGTSLPAIIYTIKESTTYPRISIKSTGSTFQLYFVITKKNNTDVTTQTGIEPPKVSNAADVAIIATYDAWYFSTAQGRDIYLPSDVNEFAIVVKGVSGGVYPTLVVSSNCVLGRKQNRLAESGATADRPGSSIVPIGYQYFDTDLGKMILWNGSAWVNIDGSALTQ